MKAEEHYQKLERLYHTANIQDFYNGSEISVSCERAEITLPLAPKFYHGAQAIHGSVYFKLLDDAAYFAVASIIQDVFIVTTSFQLNLLRPADSGTIKAVGTVRSKAKNFFIAEAILYNEKGKEIAFGNGQFLKTDQPLEKLDGYN